MSKSLRDQLLEQGLVKLAGTCTHLHKAYRLKKCRFEGRVCNSCTEYQYNECLQAYGSEKS